jgi:adenylate kinase family enzyme
VLTADDPLPRRPQRILVAGLSGAGKTTLARRLGQLLDLPHTELDALHHGPGWVPRPDFLTDVRALAADDRWVTEWGYSSARPILTPHADLLVWLDLPFRVSLGRVVRRTLRRRWHREVLWNGNLEPPLNTYFTDREHVVRYMITTRHKYDGLVPAAAAERADLTVVRLRRRHDVDRWLRSSVVPLA